MFPLEIIFLIKHIELALNSESVIQRRDSMRELTLEEIEVVTGGMPVIDF